MDWIEITLHTPAHLTDTVANVLGDVGYQGVAIERADIPDTDPWDEANIPPAQRHIIRGYIPADEHAPATQQAIQAAFARLALPIEPPVFRSVEEEDWSQAWKAHYHALRLGERMVVRPAWEPAELRPGDIEIVLDPGMAFGTGTHPTTQLCLRAMEPLPFAGATVLDLGTGSGILAVAASKLGAKHIYAVDNDPVAVEAAAENVERNGTADAVELATGSLAEVLARSQPVDIALVNILARVIIPMCDQGLGNVLRPGGKGLFGGLIVSQVDEVEAALRRTGLTPTARAQQGDWVLIEAVR